MAVVLSALGAALALLGCESTCPRETEDVPTPYDIGNTNAQGTVYETNGWDEKFVDFPAGRRVALRHGLGVVPVAWRSYVAFKECPFPGDETKPGFVAESAGNQVLLERIDDEFIRVRNDTCEHFYLRIVASSDTAGIAAREMNEGMASSGTVERCGEPLPTAGAGGSPGENAGAGGSADELAGAGGR